MESPLFHPTKTAASQRQKQKHIGPHKPWLVNPGSIYSPRDSKGRQGYSTGENAGDYTVIDCQRKWSKSGLLAKCHWVSFMLDGKPHCHKRSRGEL